MSEMCECCGGVKRRKCERHGWYDGPTCRRCDVCEHGKNLNQDCRKCHENDDPSWMSAPLSDKEIEQIGREMEMRCVYVHRHTPYPVRNYCNSYVDLIGLLLADYQRLRKAAKRDAVARE